MNKCSSCKFWNRLVTFQKHGICTKIEEEESKKERPIACLVQNELNTGTAVLVTKEEFGCTLHENIKFWTSKKSR